MSRGKWIAVVIVVALLWTVIKKWIWVVIGIIALLYLIRLAADLWWWGKDNGKW